MSEEKRFYTISAYTDNTPGVLHRVVTTFTRRKINIESLTVSETSEPGLSVFTITSLIEPKYIDTIVKQIERIVEVRKAFYSPDRDLIFKEVGLIRVSLKNDNNLKQIEEAISRHNALVVYVDETSAIIQTLGSEDESKVVLKLLESFGVLQFIRSGRIALRKKYQSIYQN